ncbi:uncharacterized protein LOC116201789 [Punica granatum]|uniref:Uncharacterized protein n=2 Tax=Punica granatum TaxID=22663 RepID=A0A2I0K371_PUNGR|nr:uncharacterized protein LOC116201789 [Punica granatum]PKI62991.1 hypothetical protein CRG98_016630 [Punica granatum]
MASNSYGDRVSCLRVAGAIGFLLILLVAKLDVEVAAQNCQGDPRALADQCSPFVKKGAPKEDPSRGCCDAVKDADIGCICQNLPKEIEQLLDMEKVVFVAGFCGKPLGHGSKCGSYIVP